MTDLRQQTIDTYNKSAKDFVKYFQGIGSRNGDIEKALKLADNPKKARVVEIGCGDGRDAKEIVKQVNEYTGFDIAQELIKLARQHVPEAKFVVADLTDFKFPANLDVVYAFASLLHSDKVGVKDVIERVSKVLKSGGIFFISLKYGPSYTKDLQEDQFGKRLFYYYNPKLIEKLAGQRFKTAYLKQHVIGHTEWFEIALKKS